MKRKLIKILLIIFVLIYIIGIFNNVWAVKGNEITGTFKGQTSNNEGVSEVRTILGMVLSVVRTVAVGISIIMITYLGIKYMSAAPTEKANIKNQLITFTIGAVLVVGAVTVIGIIREFAQDNIKV